MPDGWLAQATSSRTGICQPGRDYGYQWWTCDDGTFAARGIFIDAKCRLVITSNANWSGGARDPTGSQAREAFYQAVRKAVHDEAATAK